MQPTPDPSASVVTRRQMDVEDYLNMTRRNVSWILAPGLAGLVIAVVVAFLWPDTYISVASIRVVPPAVPERLIPTNFGMQMSERVIQMQQTILSRSTLQALIQTHDLYPSARKRYPLDDVIEWMRKDIRISPLQRLSGRRENSSAFQISFAYENRFAAQKVTRDLMNRFIDENIRTRSVQSQQTTQLLRDSFDKAKAELDAMEARLTQFRIQYAGRMPDQVGSNLQQLQALESRISTLNSNVSRASQEKMIQEGELRAARDKLAAMRQALLANPASDSPVGPGQPSRVDEELARVGRDIQGLERALERMLEQYTPEYPDVKRIQLRLENARQEREALLNKKLAVKPAAPAAAPSPAALANVRPTREILDLEEQIVRLQNALRAKDMDIARYTQEIADAERRTKEVAARIESGPVGASQYEQLIRDYELAQKRYAEIQTKLNQSEMALEGEERRLGETLEILDVPSLPETPAKPNRIPIVIGGALAGLTVGFSLAAFRELKDNSLKTLKDIRSYTKFNVLGAVPLLENDVIIRRRRRIAVMGWTTACVVSALIMSGSIYYYYAARL